MGDLLVEDAYLHELVDARDVAVDASVEEGTTLAWLQDVRYAIKRLG